MLFNIMVMTVTGTVPNAANNLLVPYSRRLGNSINIENPTMSTLVLEDDDDQLDSGLLAPGETGQLIHADLQLGSYLLQKGTRIGYHNGALIVDTEGNRFVFMYPRVFVPNDPAGGAMLTDRNSMLVIPLPDPETGIFPEFDPLKNNFSYHSTYVVNENQPFLPLQQADAELPVDPEDPVDGSPCFAGGTLILTSKGPRAVETLRPGDLVQTRDNGLQPLLWSGHRALEQGDLDLAPNQRPILIARSALGPGQPSRDLVVSPQHRILLKSPIVRRMFTKDEVLAPARLLAGLPGIRVLRPEAGVTYWHLLFARHEVVLSEGAWTESLLPGPMALRAFPPAARAQIRALVTPEDIDPARPLPACRAIRSLVGRLANNPRRRPFEGEPHVTDTRALAGAEI